MSPTDYAAVAVGRARELWSRVGFAVFIATAGAIYTGQTLSFVWLAVVLAVQAVDFWISLPLQRQPEREPTSFRRNLYATSLCVSAAVFSGISVHLWFAGDVGGKAFAILLPAGAVLAMAVRIGTARRVLVAGWAPHAAYLLGLPLLSAALSPEADALQMALLSLGGVLFLTNVLTAVLSIHRGSQALTAALVEADAQRERAQLANAAKSDFLATISHEIRTPMNAVVAASDLLRHTPLNAEQAEHVGMLSNASEVLLGLLNDVLDLSKIESGKIVLEQLPFDLVEKLERGADLWRPRAAQRGTRLELATDALPARIVTDPLRLQQILFNLVSNAVKFTDHGRIVIRGGRDLSRQVLWLEVADTGCGMDDETSARVFLSFEQASPLTTRLHGGTGLGLPISRRLAELLGGTLTVHSAVGQGSVFRLEIPLVEPEAPAAVAPEPPSAAAEETDAEGLEVLVAEDHAVNQRIVQLILEPLGCRLTIVGDGAQAVEAAALRPFDLVLMDMQMPVMDGIEATRRIRAGGPNARTPIVALSANAMAEHRAMWDAVGVHLFVAKPVNMQTLVEMVMRAVGEGETAAAEDASHAANG